MDFFWTLAGLVAMLCPFFVCVCPLRAEERLGQQTTFEASTFIFWSLDPAPLGENNLSLNMYTVYRSKLERLSTLHQLTSIPFRTRYVLKVWKSSSGWFLYLLRKSNMESRGESCDENQTRRGWKTIMLRFAQFETGFLSKNQRHY